MSSSLNAYENDQQPMSDCSQRDASYAGQVGNAQRDPNKDGQSSSQHPCRWTAHSAGQIVYGTTRLTNDFCKRCQTILDILTRVLLCWDKTPPMWAAVPVARRASRNRDSSSLGPFLVSLGGICLTITTDCEFCTFFAQIIRSTLQEEGIPQRKEVAVLLCMEDISKAEPQPDADDAHKGTARWRKALKFAIYDPKFVAVLPPLGTVFLSDELERTPLSDYFLASVEPTVRVIDTDSVATQLINSHRSDSTKSDISIGLPRLRPTFADPSGFVSWLHACEERHQKRCQPGLPLVPVCVVVRKRPPRQPDPPLSGIQGAIQRAAIECTQAFNRGASYPVKTRLCTLIRRGHRRVQRAPADGAGGQTFCNLRDLEHNPQPQSAEGIFLGPDYVLIRG